MHTARASATTTPRLYELDMLRLVAALMVVAAHYLSELTQKHRHNSSLGSIFDFGEPLASIGQYGALGVDIFFMVSGYVIALSAEGRNVRDFLASRAARILPAFWFCCLITWCLIKLDPGYREVSFTQLLVNLLFVARPLGYQFVDGVYWSLVIEIRFYLLVAAVLWWRGMQAFPAFLSVWLALAVLDMFGLVPGAIKFIALPQYAPYFIAGGAMHLIAQRKQLGFAYGLAAGAMVLVCIKASAQMPTSFASQDVTSASLMLLSALVLWLIATRRSSALGRPWMVIAGSLTYPLYLLHEDLGFLFMRHFPATGIGWIDNRFTITLVAVFVFLLMSYAVARFIEVPAAPRIRRWISSPLSGTARVLPGESGG